MTKTDAKTNGFVKRTWLYLVVTVAIVTNGLQLMFGYVDVSNFKEDTSQQIEVVDKKVNNNAKRISRLEGNHLDNRDILLEVQINLKNHILNSGQKYIDRDRKIQK